MSKSIYVTYNHHSLNNPKAKTRFAVECENMEQANEIGYELNSRVGVSNVRINKSGRGLPPSAQVFFYNEYKYLITK